MVAWIYLPGGHTGFRDTVQESVLVLFSDVEALKNPGAHASHLGWVVELPAILVYLPGGHLVWVAQGRLGHSESMR